MKFERLREQVMLEMASQVNDGQNKTHDYLQGVHDTLEIVRRALLADEEDDLK